jgi:hypothetical protein
MRKERTVVDIVDDIDGQTPAEPRRFAVNGTTYEVDLNNTNYSELQEALKGLAAAQQHLERFVKVSRVSEPEESPIAAAQKATGPDRGGPRNKRIAGPAKKTAARTAPAKKRAAKAGTESSAAIRAWGQAHGHKVGKTGKIPKAVIDAYDAERDQD